MPTFILTLNWTEQGIRAVKDAPQTSPTSNMSCPLRSLSNSGIAAGLARLDRIGWGGRDDLVAEPSRRIARALIVSSGGKTFDNKGSDHDDAIIRA
jgi:hypothetical protein